MMFNYAVNDDKIIFTNTMVYTGNVNTYECKFSFSPKWDSYDKFAVFSGDKNYTLPIADNSCKIPKEVLMAVCGKEADAKPLIKYFKEKYTGLYNL